MPGPKVIIVGAGVAGVSAALKLVHNGIDDVIVLEAQDYIGGRVKEVYIEDKPIDIGAQFIHGRDGNPFYALAAKLGRVPVTSQTCILTSSASDCTSTSSDCTSTSSDCDSLTDPGQVFLSSDGQRVPNQDVDELVSLLDDIDENRASDGRGDTVQEALDSVYDGFLEERGGDGGALQPAQRELYDATFRWFMNYLLVDNSSEDLKRLSRRTEYVVLPGERCYDVTGGVAGVMAALVDQLPANIVKLNTPVRGIEWTDSPQTKQHSNSTTNTLQQSSPSPSSSSSSSLPVKVTCCDGTVLSADHVILTISMGCLQATHATLFTPPLPLPARQAIDHVGFGVIGKIFLLFEEAWWENMSCSENDNFDSFQFLWLDSHMPDIKSDRSKKKTKTGKPWWWNIMGLDTVQDFPRVLEVWLNHDQIEASEELSDQEVMSVCADVIRSFIPDEPIADPVSVYRTKWLSNPYVRGTYSYPTTSLTGHDRDVLGQPLPSPQEPRLQFAGEAYSRQYFSTVHGAFISGNTAAHTLLDKYGLEAKQNIIDIIDTSKSI